MHELSIVQSIIDIAESEVRKAGAHSVESIELEIGDLAGVEFSALDFAWDVAVRHTVLERAERQIRHVEGSARCSDCGQEFIMKQLFDACPSCGQYFNEILQGKELKVKALVVI